MSLLLLTALLQVQSVIATQSQSEGGRPIPEYRIFGTPHAVDDPAKIDRLMEKFNRAWADEDLDELLAVYSDDVEWTNAFGSVVRGHDELRTYLSELFEIFDSSAGAEESSRGVSVSRRYLGPGVAVLHNITESTRGGGRGSSDIRMVHITYVLNKRLGKWKIVHQMIMDARN